MRKIKLPKWCVQWVKDDFTLEKAELIIQQQKEEIRKLQRKNYLLKFDALPEKEKEWALNAYMILVWEIFSWKMEEFKEEYMKDKEKKEINDLPFW